MEKYKRYLAWLDNKIELLINSSPIPFSNLVPSKLPHRGRGIYYIALNETDEVLYVGRTIDMRRRLYTNHLQGPIGTARLKKYLINDISLPEVQCPKGAKDWIKQNCYCKFILIEDTYERGILEGGLLGALGVRYIEKEH